MLDYLDVKEGDKELRQKMQQIARKAATEKAGDRWTKFKKPDRAPITCVLGQLKILMMNEGEMMVIHADDLHSKCINFNRHITRRTIDSLPQARDRTGPCV